MEAVVLSISGSASITERAAPRPPVWDSLARVRGASYLAVVAWVATLAGCRAPVRPLVPLGGGFAAIEEAAFAAVAARTLPAGSQLLQIRWRFRDASSAVSGRGAVRLTPPDSLRLDVRGPLGFGRGTLVLAGDTAWADPAGLVAQVLPRRFLVWAMLGAVQAPDSAARFEAADEGPRRQLRVTEAGGDATTFELRGDTLTGVVRTRGDRVVGRLALVRDGTGAVVHADAEDLERDAHLEFDIQSRAPSGAFPAEVWRHP
jgi:hypothetical protein